MICKALLPLSPQLCVGASSKLIFKKVGEDWAANFSQGLQVHLSGSNDYNYLITQSSKESIWGNVDVVQAPWIPRTARALE